MTTLTPQRTASMFAAAVFAIAATTAQAEFTSYHDFGATSGGEQSTGFITTHQTGSGSAEATDLTVKALINYADGSATGATFQVTTAGNGMDGRNAGQTSAPDAATPADPLFNVTGLNLSNGMLSTGNPNGGGETTMVFTLGGLDPNGLYDIAMYGNRNASADGADQFTLGGADASTNASSTGIISSTVTRLDTRTNQALGHIVRWIDIDPGADGIVTITTDTDWDGSQTNLAYLNALRLVEQPATSGIPAPAALPAGLALIAMVAARRRRRA